MARRLFVTRGCLAVLLVSVLAYRAGGGLAFPLREPDCMWDGLFEATSEINSFLGHNEPYRAALLIFSSLLIDALMLTSALRFMFFAKTWRSLLYLLSFYSIRGIIMGMFLMGFPEGHIFSASPGFPSLTVSYVKTSDFFYSGHVGFAVFGVLENRYYHNRVMMWVAWVAVVIESFTMIVTRGHYSIDVVTGMVFAHYVWTVAGWVSPFVDKKLIAPKDVPAQAKDII